MDKSEIEAAALRFFEIRLTNDAHQVAALFAPGASVVLSGDNAASGFPVGCADDAEVRALIEAMTADWRFEEVEILKLVIDGATAAAYFRVTVRHAPTDAKLTTDALDLFTFESGLIKEFVEFVDTARLNQVTHGGR